MPEKAELAAKSVVEYTRSIQTLINRECDYLNKDELVEYRKAFNLKDRTWRFLLCSIVWKLRGVQEQSEYRKTIQQMIKESNDKITKEEVEQIMSDTQKEKDERWDVVVDKSLKYINDETKMLENRILVGLYTMLNPTRLDYVHMRCYKEEPEEKKATYFVINEKEQVVVINEHKTAWKKGALREVLPERLKEMILNWYAEKPDAEMFPITENNLCKRVTKVFREITGKPMTATSLRHSRINHHFGDAPMLKENKALAASMGHSVTEQQAYRFRPAEK
jgi:integrase